MKFALFFFFLLVGGILSAQKSELPANLIRDGKFAEAITLIEGTDELTSQMNYGHGIILSYVVEKDQKFLDFVNFARKSNTSVSNFYNAVYHVFTKEGQKDKVGLEEQFQKGFQTESSLDFLAAMYVVKYKLSIKDYDDELITDVCTEAVKKLSLLNTRTQKPGFASFNKLLIFEFSKILYEKGHADDYEIFMPIFDPEDLEIQAFLPLSENKKWFTKIPEYQLKALEKSTELSVFEKKFLASLTLLSEPNFKRKKQAGTFFKDEKELNFLIDSVFNERHPSFQNHQLMLVFDSVRKPGKWTVIDVWGTWCGPCVEELPVWQKFAMENREKIVFLAASAYSKDADKFLSDKKYSFQNINLTDAQVKSSEIDSFPTTFLISPEGKFVVIPFGSDKVEFIKVLTGI